MSQQINLPVSRKLQKQRFHGVSTQQDFVACLIAEKLLQRVKHSNMARYQESGSAMLLYERNTDLSPGLSGIMPVVDQVPFDMIRVAPEQLMSMLASEQYSLLLSNLAFDWIDAGAFIRLMDYLLKPDGEFWISSYGPQTACNTRLLLSAIDQYAHFNVFYDLQDIGDALLGAGFKDVVLESSIVNIQYDSVDALLADTVRVFGVNTNPGKRKSLTPKRVVDDFKRRIEGVIQSEGAYSEQVEILIAHGKKASVPGMKGSIPVRQG